MFHLERGKMFREYDRPDLSKSSFPKSAYSIVADWLPCTLPIVTENIWLSSTPIPLAMNVTRAVLPHFRQKRAGTIVFNSSYFAWSAMPSLSPYCGAKAALSNMVSCLQMEVGNLGIRCLCVEPGHFRTPVLNPAGGNVKPCLLRSSRIMWN
jgi:hypothetical protein